MFEEHMLENLDLDKTTSWKRLRSIWLFWYLIAIALDSDYVGFSSFKVISY